MSFLKGSVTALRFAVQGERPRLFGDEHLERLRNHQAGRQRIASADGVECGWTAGTHVLDTDFQLAKNIINDALLFELRIDTDKLPPELMKAYYETELKALAASNPSGFASARQKREAREVARERLEQEAKDGRFRKRKCIPILWDAKSNEVLFGATSVTHVGRFAALFQQTFGHGLDAMTAGRRAYALAELREQTRNVDDCSPSAFVPGYSPADVAWIPDEASRDFIGNEFLLWLWYQTEVETDAVALADGSEVTVMMSRKIILDCPRGQTGCDAIAHEGPTRLPEAKRAVKAGKLPRRTGLILVRHADQFSLALHAEALAVAGAKLPNPPEDVTDARARLECRIDHVRGILETLDLLYDAFGRKRFGAEWGAILPRAQKWLAQGERMAA